MKRNFYIPNHKLKHDIEDINVQFHLIDFDCRNNKNLDKEIKREIKKYYF